MSRAIQDATACLEGLSRLPELDLGELRQQWRALYKANASPHLSRDLLVRVKLPRFRGVELDVGDYGSVVTASIAAS